MYKSEQGFSYIDVMIAIVILTVGILALLSGISGSVLQARGHEQQLLAKQVATSTMESIMSVKETDPERLGWSAVGNVGSNPDGSGVNQGIFVNGNNPVFLNPGPDQVIGTGDDNGPQVGNLQRQIVIQDICDIDRPSPNCSPSGVFPIRMRSVKVTIIYHVGAIQRQEVLTTILTDYAVAR
jgi:type II secretory pathway pseudopilin PulG